MTPHVHADIIKAWADGAQVEVWVPTRNTWEWVDTPYLAFRPECLYRIKPIEKKKVKLYQVLCKTPSNTYWSTNYYFASLEIACQYHLTAIKLLPNTEIEVEVD